MAAPVQGAVSTFPGDPPVIAITRPSATTTATSSSNDEQATGHDRFLDLLPAIRRHARVAFRHRDPEAREEAIHATIAHSWTAFIRLFEQGRAELAYAGPLAAYAIARIREGRSIGNRLNARDLTSIRCQRRHGVQIESLNQADGRGDWHEILVEDRRASPAETAIVRIDFSAWLDSLSRRDRRIAEVLASGESTMRAARRFGLSVGRVSQLRHKLHKAWCRFQGEVQSVPATERA
jgi:hypothetical protein